MREDSTFGISQKQQKLLMRFHASCEILRFCTLRVGFCGIVESLVDLSL